jgi:ferredoxin
MEGNVSEVARALAAARRPGPRRCVFCGKDFVGYAWRKYCSTSCMYKAYRQRHREEVLQRKREAYRRRKGIQGQQQEGQI